MTAQQEQILASNAAPRRAWLVTGCSSGLGRALSEVLLSRGERVVCTARQTARIADLADRHPDRALALPLDVTEPASIGAAVPAALDWTGGIDVLVNNAGYGLVGALEEVDEEALKRNFDANIYGPYRMIRALLPHMRARGRGHIVNVSSMTGFVGAPGFCFYSATKFALEGMSEALAQEVAPFGIRVTIVEPGPFRTEFRNRSMESAPPMEAYAATIGRFREALMETDGKQPGDPYRGAEAMIAAVDAETPPLRLPLGAVCVGAIRGKLERVSRELDAWEAVSVATSYEAAE
ncbi:oxidoreductase [Propylenella binzhouense]|uniref:SDR family NAD(P)-dependent oxidoreductase n=1 Tax=Propylenella binzhouense TaxID=2555902 RepID=A0A964T0U9_9HYPH|nr:oxidoreductase [Propylenella binzhouense]MYZ46346.1 SDR family NAD(P)-dependent oxidoreductase [Propylenella binzhouense]